MNGLFSKLKNKKSQQFLKNREHRWFYDSPAVLETFSQLYSTTKDYKKIKSILEKIVFVQSNGQYACAVKSDVNIIIIFPELIFIMKNGQKEQAVAVLLHEIGHIALEHQKKGTPNQQAQVEADFFAAELGYGKYLFEFLKNQRRNPQIETRLTALSRVLNTPNN